MYRVHVQYTYLSLYTKNIKNIFIFISQHDNFENEIKHI